MKVQRCPVDDLLTRDGETAVLAHGKALRLSAVAVAVYDLTEHEIEVESLAEALESQVGAPADRSTLEATEAAVAMMVRHGILRRSSR